MAMIKYKGNLPVPSTFKMVVGNEVTLKVEAVEKRFTLGVKIDAPHILALQSTNHNTRSDTWQFTIVAKQQGLSRLAVMVAKDAGRGTPLALSPASITISVEAPIELPAANSEVGMLVRLLLLESPAPSNWGGKDIAADIKHGMQLMRCVIANRLNSGKPGAFAAANARTAGDIIMADDNGAVQFHGFNQYPKLSSDMQGNLDAILEVANDGTHRQYELYAKFVQAALDVANGPMPSDPSRTGVFGWRTTGSGSPGRDFEFYKDVGGNTFYTHKTFRKAN